METEKKMLKLQEFANAIGYTPQYLSMLIQKGVVTPRVSSTGRRFFYDTDVIDWFDGVESDLFKRKASK